MGRLCTGRGAPGELSANAVAEERDAEIGVIDEDAVDPGIRDHLPLGLVVAEGALVASASELRDQELVLWAASPREHAQPAVVCVGDDARRPGRPAEAIGRGTPVVVGIACNTPLWAHPRAQESAATLRRWGCTVIDPVRQEDRTRLAPVEDLLAAVERVLGAAR